VQIFTVGVLNIVTDLMLLVLPIPVVASLRSSWRAKLHLYILFTLAIFTIIFTIIRLPVVWSKIDDPEERTIWTSTELLVIAVVVNVPSLYGLWNKRRRDKIESDRQKALHEARQTGDGPVHPDTIGGTNEWYELQRRSKPSAQGILVTTDVVLMSGRGEVGGLDGEESEETPSQPPDLENASQHSSHREMLRS
jgi:hypothetical protein